MEITTRRVSNSEIYSMQCAKIEEWNDGEWTNLSEYNYWELSDYDRETDTFRHNQKVIVINS